MYFREFARLLLATYSAIVFAIDSASRRTPQNALPPSAFAGLLQPAPTGSISTKSVKASHVWGLSSSRVAAASRLFTPKEAMRGPTSPRLRKADAAPGPPLNTKVTGRLVVSPPLAAYAV